MFAIDMQKPQQCKFLSIGIPAYNQGQYLRSTIESLLNQEVLPLEIVVSDNWSNDNTSKIISEFGDQVKLISPPRHLGMMEHWNFVVSQLKGEWFSLLSSDDEAMPNFVKKMFDGIRASENAVLVRSGFENIDQNGLRLNKRYILSVKKITQAPDTFYEQLIGPKVSFAAFSAKKSAWERVGGFPENLRLNGDWGFWLKISLLGDFIYMHSIVSRYRTGYRPTLKKDRLLATLQDHVAIYTQVIPDIKKYFTYLDDKSIAAASKTRFLSSLGMASQLLDSDNERRQVSEILKQWAEQIGCNHELVKFDDGMQFPYKDKYSYLRIKARAIIQAFRSL